MERHLWPAWTLAALASGRALARGDVVSAHSLHRIALRDRRTVYCARPHWPKWARLAYAAGRARARGWSSAGVCSDAARLLHLAPG